MSPRSILTLNQDVLSEILAHILLDTPCEPERAAVLRSCSLLHVIGLPHLYAVVDLMGFRSVSLLGKYLKTLFGESGPFSEQEGRGRWVTELRLGGVLRLGDFQDFIVPALHLPNCSSLQLDTSTVIPSLASFFRPILSDLPIERLLIGPKYGAWALVNSHTTALDVALGLPARAWPTLQSVAFKDAVWFDSVQLHPDLSYPRLSLSLWAFRTLVICYPRRLANDFDLGGHQFSSLFLPSNPVSDPSSLLSNTNRIELSVYPELEQKFREIVGARGGREGLSAFQRRIAGMMVFIDEDGTERRLLE